MWETQASLQHTKHIQNRTPRNHKMGYNKTNHQQGKMEKEEKCSHTDNISNLMDVDDSKQIADFRSKNHHASHEQHDGDDTSCQKVDRNDHQES